MLNFLDALSQVQSLAQLLLVRLDDGVLLQGDLGHLPHISHPNWPRMSARSFSWKAARDASC